MNVNAMYRTPATSPATLFLRLLIAGAGAALVAGLFASRVPEPWIIVGVIVAASLFGWHGVNLVPARVRSQHRFTVVSRCGDGFLTIDSSGVRRVARRLVLDGPST